MKKTIFIAGHNGMVGSALYRQLQASSGVDLLTASRQQLDLLNQSSVLEFLSNNPCDEIYLAAAKVGGIYANSTYPADFLYENLMIESNIIHSAHLCDVNKLLFLGSSCIYPKLAEQPMTEASLMTGPLEPTNEPYAIAKIAGIKLCESYARQYDRDYRSVMPTNLYGPNDNFHPENSHVIPGLMLRFHQAKINNEPEILAWGSGLPRREFLHVDDMASACIHVMGLSRETYEANTEPMLGHINVGVGKDCTIRELVELIGKVVGYEGRVSFDDSKPDGMPRKLLDVNKLNTLGWEANISLEKGLKHAYKWFVENISLL